MPSKEELWDQYQKYTNTTSSVARQLAYGFLGFCWVLKENQSSSFILIYIALIFIGLFFFLDGLQYWLGAKKRRDILYEKYNQKEYTLIEKKDESGKPTYEWPDNYDDQIYLVWCLKLMILSIALFFIILEVIAKIMSC